MHAQPTEPGVSIVTYLTHYSPAPDKGPDFLFLDYMDYKKLGFNTRQIHAGLDHTPETGARGVAIYPTAVISTPVCRTLRRRPTRSALPHFMAVWEPLPWLRA